MAALSGRPPRADAVRNRAKVLAAAEEVVAERGAGASTEEIARRAGVGVGTVFRHFPTKESLLTAVLVALLQRLADQATALAAAEDAGEAFFSFFGQVVAQATAKNAVSAALAEAGAEAGPSARETGGELRTALAVLLERAQRAGAVRADIGLAEVMALLTATSHTAEQATAVRARVLHVVFDGMRSR